MAALITHDFFGQDAFGAALQSAELETPDERDAFLLGNQGPDPLFYLILLPPLDAFRRLGGRMHDEGPSSLLAAMRTSVDALDESEQPIGRAYLAGFVCHYLLDRAVHPLVKHWVQGICEAGVPGLDGSDASAVHAEIERDWDEMVLYTKRNQTIMTYKPYEEVLRVREEVLNIVGKVYFAAAVAAVAEGEPTAVRVYPIAVSCYKRALKMMYSPRGMKRKLVGAVERRALRERYAISQAMAYRPRAETTSVYDNHEHRPWTNPFTGKRCTDSFWDLYNDALEEVPAALATVLAPGFDANVAAGLTLGLNFSGEPVE